MQSTYLFQINKKKIKITLKIFLILNKNWLQNSFWWNGKNKIKNWRERQAQREVFPHNINIFTVFGLPFISLFLFILKKRLLIPSTSQETKQNGFLSVVLLTLAITSNTSYLYSTTYTTLVTKSTTRNVDTLCKLRANIL